MTEFHRQLHPERNDNSPASDPRWVIWSEEHGAWWAPGRAGYVTSLERAGRYDKEKAVDIMERANRYLPEGRIHEVAMPDPLMLWRRRG